MCHHAIDARLAVSVMKGSPTNSLAYSAEVVFQCPRDECNRLFIGRYSGFLTPNTTWVEAKLRSVAPSSPKAPSIPVLVGEISPSFTQVYKQAAAAEAWELGEIAGCGYRRALEFLVKDYTISLDPTSADAIKKKFLGTVISEHIEDPSIKECARRATWLGNDETHYVRRWETKDIQDLKALITLTAGWISAHLLMKKYLSEMPE